VFEWPASVAATRPTLGCFHHPSRSPSCPAIPSATIPRQCMYDRAAMSPLPTRHYRPGRGRGPGRFKWGTGPRAAGFARGRGARVAGRGSATRRAPANPDYPAARDPPGFRHCSSGSVLAVAPCQGGRSLARYPQVRDDAQAGTMPEARLKRPPSLTMGQTVADPTRQRGWRRATRTGPPPSATRDPGGPATPGRATDRPGSQKRGREGD
jgi:hypothetical protein